MGKTRKKKVIPLSGRLIMSQDPSVIGENFQSLKNLKPVKDHLEGVAGMTKVNTTVPTTYFKGRSAHHFQKDKPVESHLLVQEYNSGLTASQVLENTVVPPAQGNFSPTALHTDAVNAGPGRFSDAPGGNVAYCNGEEAMIWGGDEARIGEFKNFDPNGSFSYDFTEQVQNTLVDAKNVATLRNFPAFGVESFFTVLMLHMNGVDGSTVFVDSGGSPKTVTATGDAQIDAGNSKFGGASGLFDGLGDYLTIPDTAAFDLSGGNWTVDFWINPLSFGNYLFSQSTDSDNLMWLNLNGAGNLDFTIRSGGANVLSFGVVPLNPILIGAWTHIEIAEEGDNYYAFVNGVLAGSAVDTDRPANYTGVFEIGESLNDPTWVSGRSFDGNMDEFRITNGAARHTSNFEPPETPYSSTEQCYSYVRSTRPLKGYAVDIVTANTRLGSLSTDYWNGSNYVDASSGVDGTASGGIPLAVSGDVTFDSTAFDAKPKMVDGVLLYTYRMYISGGVSQGTAISGIRVDKPFQDIVDIWDGINLPIFSFQKFENSSFQDNTVNVFEDTFDSVNTGTFAVLSGLSTSDYLIFGFDFQQTALRVNLIGGAVNTTTDTALILSYWNGTEWVVAFTQNGTSEGSISFAKSGIISWDAPDLVAEFRQDINKGLPLFYYKIEFTQALSADVKLFHVAGIPAQETIKGHKFPFFADNRLWLCSEKSDKKNTARVSRESAPDVWNGTDTETFQFGNETELAAAAWIYSQVGADIRSIKIFTKANETWIVEGTGPTNWIKYQLSDKIGCVAPETMRTFSIGADQSRQVAIWQGARGIYICDGSSIVPIHADIFQFFEDRKSPSINLSGVVGFSAFVDNENMAYHWLFADGVNVALNREFVYLYGKQQWFEISRGTGKELQFGFQVHDAEGNDFNYGLIDAGYMERLENGTDFDGTAIDHELHTGDMSLDGLLHESEVDRVKLISVAKEVTANGVVLTHYGDSEASGTQYPSASLSSPGKRISMSVIEARTDRKTFHSFKLQISTDDEIIGYEPIAIGIFYKDLGEDLN